MLMTDTNWKENLQEIIGLQSDLPGNIWNNRKVLRLFRKIYQTLDRDSTGFWLGNIEEWILLNDLVAVYEEFGVLLNEGAYKPYWFDGVAIGLSMNEIKRESGLSPEDFDVDPSEIGYRWDDEEEPKEDDEWYFLLDCKDEYKYINEAMFILRKKVHVQVVAVLYDTFGDGYGIFQAFWLAQTGAHFILPDENAPPSTQYPYKFWREALEWVRKSMPLR